MIVDRLGVGHTGDAREASRSRGAGSTGDRLLVLEAGLAQVDVHVHEARRDDAAGGVHALGAVGVEARPELFDFSVDNAHIELIINAIRRVYDAAVLN